MVVTMPDENFLLYQAIAQDDRYPIDAYQFVREAVAYADDNEELGEFTYDLPAAEESYTASVAAAKERHLTGQQLCEAIRLYAINQFGYMARVVLKNWGITETSSFGDIVYNMIDVGVMKKSPLDERSHFDDVYSFDVLDVGFEICNSVAAKRV